MAITYDPIATQTLGSNTSVITFSSIPATYTDLLMVVNSGGSVNLDWDIRINGDNGSNYSVTRLQGDGSTVSSNRASNQTEYRINGSGFMTTTIVANSFIHFMNYANTSIFKTMLARVGNANTGVSISAGFWRSTSAINQIQFSNWGGPATYITGSTFTLYGIKAA